MSTTVLRRWTTDEYHRMAEAGLLGEDDRVELLEGRIVQMAPIGARHNACVNRLTRLLQAQVHNRAIVQVQGSMALSADSEPQPDLAILRWRDDFYRDALPAPSDVVLLVEVADTSTETDRSKLALYAAAGVPQVWLVDLPTGVVEDHRDAGPSGYRSMTAHRPSDQLVVEALPDIVVDPAGVLA